MVDPRITRYRDAALAMKQGRFIVDVPVGQEDEVGQLGKALGELGRVLEAQFEQIQALARITERVNAGLILDEVLSYVFESFRPLIPYERIGFSLLEDHGRIVRARWARSDAPEMKITAGYSQPIAGSSLQQIIQTGRPRILNDLVAYLQEHPNSESTQLIIEEGMRSSLTCPLIALGKPVGFMFFSSVQPNTYRNAHVELFLQIAGQLATIVEKSRLYQELVELNQLKDRFLGMAAHDLRNPITVIKGYLELMLDGDAGRLSEEQQGLMLRMDAACEGMLGLINDLLDVNAIQSGRLDVKFQPVDFARFLRECFDGDVMLARSKAIKLTLDLPMRLPAVEMDPRRIIQVVDNLISNAIKFSHSDTEVTLRAAVTDADGREDPDGEWVAVAVQDQGQGIPADELPKMFVEFGKTSVRPTADEKSTGLGLAIIKRILEAHRGRIWVESQVGVGSTFTFTLPLRQA